MRALITLFAVGLLLPSSASIAGAAEKGEKLICKTLAESGTRLSAHRVCKSREAWKNLDGEARKTVEQFQEKSLVAPGREIGTTATPR